MVFEKTYIKFKENLKLRRMGFIKDQQGIINRYYNEKQNWDNYLENSKKFILKSAGLKKKGQAIILGSGWLLDLPIKELSNLFDEVVLVDIIHPKQIQNQIKNYKNVKLIKADITGGLIDFIYSELKLNSKKQNKRLLPSAGDFNFDLPPNADFVISLNVMIQLHVILTDYIKKFDIYSSNALLDFDKKVQQAHLKILPRGKTCLITDIEEEILDKKGNVVGVNPLIHVDLPKGNFSQLLQWKFDTRMTYRENVKTYFNTKAIDF